MSISSSWKLWLCYFPHQTEILQMELSSWDSPKLSKWVQWSHYRPPKAEDEEEESIRRSRKNMRHGKGSTHCCWLEKWRGNEPRNTGHLQKLGKTPARNQPGKKTPTLLLCGHELCQTPERVWIWIFPHIYYTTYYIPYTAAEQLSSRMVWLETDVLAPC